MSKQNPANHILWNPEANTPVEVDVATQALKVYTVNGGSGGTASSFGSSFPSIGTASGAEDPSGNMAPFHVDGSGNLLISGSFSASFAEDVKEDTGSASSAAVIFTQADTTGYYSAYFTITSIGSCTVVCETENPTSGVWALTAVQPVSAPGTYQTAITSNGTYAAPTGSKGWRLRVSVYDSSSTVSADGFFRGFPISWGAPSTVSVSNFPATQPVSGTVTANQGTAGASAWKVDGSAVTQPVSAAALPLPTGASTSALQTTGNTALTTINTTLGSPFQAGGSIGNTAFGVSGPLPAGTNLLGKVGIDQTTPGTTNAVSVTNFPATQPVSGTVAATQSGTWNITNVSGTVSLPTGAATSANQPTNATIGSTTSGQTGTLAQGAVTTAAPTYSTSQTNPLSLTTAGALRIDGSGATQPISGTVTANAGTNLNTSLLALESGGNLATLAGAVTGGIEQTNLKQVNGVTTLAGTGAVGTGAQRVAVGTDTATIAGSAPGTAGSASANVVTVQGVTSMTPVQVSQATAATLNATVINAAGSAIMGKVGIDQTTVGTTNAVSLAQIGANTVLTGNGTSGTGAQRVTISSDNTAIAGWGLGATGSAVPSGAQYGGLLAKTANPTAASDGNMVGAMSDKLGRQVMVIGNVRDNKANQFTTITSSTAETTVVTAVASTFLDVYGVIVENSSATATEVLFKDSTAGTTQFSLYVPAGDTRGLMLPSSDGFKQTTVNNNWTATSSASVASLKISMLYVKNL